MAAPEPEPEPVKRLAAECTATAKTTTITTTTRAGSRTLAANAINFQVISTSGVWPDYSLVAVNIHTYVYMYIYTIYKATHTQATAIPLPC